MSQPAKRMQRAVHMTVLIDMTGPHAITDNRMNDMTDGAAKAVARMLDDLGLEYREVNVDAFSMYGPWQQTAATKKRPPRVLKKRADS